MPELLYRWFKYFLIFVTILFVVESYNEYTQSKEFDKVRKDLVQQEQKAIKAQEANCLKNALWYEAGNQGYAGVIAVASVIENRKNHPDYPSSYCEVIKQKGQFSFTMLNKPDVETLQFTNPMVVKAYSNVESTVQNIQNKQFEPVLHHSVLWYTTTSVRNYWTKTKVVAARIGQHVFYKDKK